MFNFSSERVAVMTKVSSVAVVAATSLADTEKLLARAIAPASAAG